MANDALVERRRLINASSAKLIKTIYVPGSRRIKEIQLYWAISEAKTGRKALEYLADYCSTLNGNSKRQWVDNPLGGLEGYEGRWRQVSLQYTRHGDNPGVIQVLRRGWLVELSTDEAADSEARFFALKRDMCTQKLNLTRMWVNIDPEYLANIEQALKARVNVINPQCEVLDSESDQLIGQKRYTGRFAVAERRADPLQGQTPGQPDATCTLYEQLQEVSLPTNITELGALTPEFPKYDNELKRIFTTATGDYDVIALEYKFMDVLARGYLMGECSANLNTLVAAGDYTSWATGLTYAIGQKIVNSGTRYMCLVAHTAGTFATDLTAGKWSTLDGWAYADRHWANQEDNTATFTVFYQRIKWQTGATAADAVIIQQSAGIGRTDPSVTRIWLRRTWRAYKTLVGISAAWGTNAYVVDDLVTQGGNTYICLIAHTGGTFATDLAAGKWAVTDPAGIALSALTYQTVAYQHVRWELTENHWDVGSYNVVQYLSNPANTISIHDTTGSHLYEAKEALVYFNTTFKWQRCLIEDFAAIYGSYANAAAYADGSSLFYNMSLAGGVDYASGIPMTMGYVRYLGNNRWEGHCVKITKLEATAPTQISNTTVWPSTPP